MSIDTFWQVVSGQGGVILFLLIILWAGKTKLWVWGYQLKEAHDREREKQNEADEWRDRFLQAMSQATTATEVLHTQIRKTRAGESSPGS